MTQERDYRDTVFLPKTDFPMKAGLPQKEPGILARWQEQDLYGQIRKSRKGREQFILHDGPPYANGDMHIGHALNHILKDMVVRTQSLLGKDAPYVPGWDCHGLPIEWKVEEEYRKKKRNKDEVPPKEFRAECRAYAQGWVDKQREQLKRLGINGDWDKPYLTMAFDAEATIVSELMKFATSGQLYRGAKPVMWSPVEKTALAEAEVEYEDITSTQIDVAFEIVESPIPELVGAHAVIWTTTPWTIPVNQAIAYGPDISYVLIESNSTKFVVSKQRLPRTMSDIQAEVMVAYQQDIARRPFGPHGGAGVRAASEAQRLEGEAFSKSINGDRFPRIIQELSGSDFAGTIARHPMHHLGGFFAKPRPFLPGNFVTTEQGTGLVHMAPDHGEDDFELCKANGIDPVFAVEGDGKYRADWAWLGGQGSVINPKFNAPDGPICADLREAGALLAASADYRHSYPHSWRSKAKVIFRATPQWFIPVDKPIAIEPHKPVRAEPVEAPTLSSAEKSSPSTSSGRTELGHAKGVPATLRELAMAAIADTRFVPEKGRNRIGAMVEGRPDWVISRQRAWGVPITLFVNRKTGQYLVDADVNARIVAAIREEGVDAWEQARAQDFLGSAYKADDYEMVTDILDVWFDSGCTHAFVLESGKWPELRWPADLYLEGSDQHRGWFQSSLLQSCGTRGRAPYDAVLTHGFTMDAKGMKMSKSLGNTISPLDLMRDYGADILRLWALSVDYTEDHRIGDEILKGVADQYRKLRNTFRYLLGALDGFSEEERIPDVAQMPELERYILHLLADLDTKLRRAVGEFDFNNYTRLLSDFANNDLSAFFFDIRKDSLYCDAAHDMKRRSYRTVLDILFHALVRYAAPVLVFTAEEVWGTRYPEAGSVHLLEWPDLAALARHNSNIMTFTEVARNRQIGTDDQPLNRVQLLIRWRDIRAARSLVSEGIEPYRRDKIIGSSLESDVILTIRDKTARATCSSVDMAEMCITASCHITSGNDDLVTVTRTPHHKCGRCWRHLPEVATDGALCTRCEGVVGA